MPNGAKSISGPSRQSHAASSAELLLELKEGVREEPIKRHRRMEQFHTAELRARRSTGVQI